MSVSVNPMANLNPNPNGHSVHEPLLKRVNRLSTRISHLDRQSILRIGEISGHGGNRFYNVIMDFIIFLVTTLEIIVVLYLSINHFLGTEGSDLMALAMLLPILLNFVGVTYFLSDKLERRELEKASGSSKCATDFLQVPIFGPVFTALKVLRVSCGCSPNGNYERIEASAIKMRQAGGFFCAAPEALIQLTVLLTSRPMIDFDGALEMFAVLLFTITLAESNCYNPLSKYYQMFRDHEPNDWKLSNVKLWQKIILFLHAFSSIGSRIMASATLKASAMYFCPSKSFPLVITLTIFGEIGYRIIIYYASRCTKFFAMGKEIPSGCYEAISYGWRSTILDFGFQSENVIVQILFYFENVIAFTLWCVVVYFGFTDQWIKDLMFYPMVITFISLMVFSVFSLLTCNFFRLIDVRGPFQGRHMPDL